MADPKTERERLSKVPSWMMLGAVVGAILALAAKEQYDAHQAAARAMLAAAVEAGTPGPKPTPEPVIIASPHHASLYEYEDIFARWEQNAVWYHDITQVAFWNPVTNQYSEAVEVLRNGDDYYFRTLPKLTWPLVDVGVSPDQPLRFAEPESVHAERRARAIVPFVP